MHQALTFLDTLSEEKKDIELRLDQAASELKIFAAAPESLVNKV